MVTNTTAELTVEERKAKIAELFDEAIQTKPQLDRCLADLNACQNKLAPKKPKIVESLDEWLDYVAADADYRDNLLRARYAHEDAYTMYTEILNELRALIPAEVWFRHGEHAIGISFSDWGGSHHTLQIAKWGDKLPSLDKRYYGD